MSNNLLAAIRIVDAICKHILQMSLYLLHAFLHLVALGPLVAYILDMVYILYKNIWF